MRIIIANPYGIGDVLFSTPLIRSIRAKFPQSHIAYLCNARTIEILEHNPHLNEIIVFEKDEYRSLWRSSKSKCISRFFSLLNKIRKGRFDVLVDLSLGDRYSLVFMLLGVRRRVGFDYKGRGRFLTKKIAIKGFNDKPAPHYYLDVAGLIGAEPDYKDLDFRIPDESKKWADDFLKQRGISDKDTLIGVVPGGGFSWGSQAYTRRWDSERFKLLCNRLTANLNASLIFFGGGAEESALCAQISKYVSGKWADASGKTTLSQFAALLSKCRLVVGNEGGALHVALSQNVPIVAIFGPVDYKVYGPYPQDERVVIVAKHLECQPCYHSFRMPPCPYELKCLRDVSVDDVLDGVNIQLERKR